MEISKPHTSQTVSIDVCCCVCIRSRLENRSHVKSPKILNCIEPPKKRKREIKQSLCQSGLLMVHLTQPACFKLLTQYVLTPLFWSVCRIMRPVMMWTGMTWIPCHDMMPVMRTSKFITVHSLHVIHNINQYLFIQSFLWCIWFVICTFCMSVW